MKKYRLRLKYEQIGQEEPYIWLSIKNDNHCSYYQSKDSATVFTMEDIGKLEYGFVKGHVIVEIKDELYYIKMPYTDSEYGYVNEIVGTGKVTFGDKTERCGSKTKFTKKEIKEKYPLYSYNNFMIKVEDDE